MIDKKFEKVIGLISENQYNLLKNSIVLIFGLGGVGSYVLESLVRVGISNFIIVDYDKIDISNINRQLSAYEDNVNMYKTEVYTNRLKRINNEINISSYNIKITENFDFNKLNLNKNIDFIIDCIDDIKAKIEIIKYAKKNNFNIISSMGTANHLFSTNIKISDIFKTNNCPLAKKMRVLLKENKLNNIPCLYLDETPINIKDNILNYYNEEKYKTSTISYIPSICGLKIAEYVINKILNNI